MCGNASMEPIPAVAAVRMWMMDQFNEKRMVTTKAKLFPAMM
jgi:hypothetical protein